MKIIDISMEISEDMIVYPENPEPELKQYATVSKDGSNESKITLGSHTGTHIDAPYHVKENGKTLGEMPLESFYGECKVLDLIDAGNEIHKDDLIKFEINEDDIILLKTENSTKQYKKFRKDFTHIKLDAAEFLVEKNIKALGVDYLSVEKFNGDEGVHDLLLDNLTVFEGLCLKDVDPSEYIFVGLPLKIDGDGAPVRAILISY
ncbi:cyclase family protein [Methanobacterium sp. ACI-7]|uniref:cyclase family protein n=1 Tax=unclassified Methanobacterium TaxID=2627676 RepID=UPI0039C39AF5